jgi:competence protein ComEA
VTRTHWLGVVVIAGAALGLGVFAAWPSQRPALDCPPGQVHLDPAGLAHCGPGSALPAAQALAVGQKLDLNAASAEDLAAIPGLGREAATALVEARNRLGPFRNWDAVDAVPGIGPARLEALQKMSEFPVWDAGAW